MSSKKLLLRNSSLSFTLNLTAKAANVLIFIAIGRLEGADQAGNFSLATTYLLIFSALTFGLDELVIRQVTRHRELTGRYFSTFLAIRVVLSIFLYIIMVVVVQNASRYEDSLVNLILILGFCMIPDSLAYVGQAVLFAHERFEIPVVAALLSAAIKISGGFAALYLGAGLIGVGWSWIIGCIISCIVLLIAARQLAGNLSRFSWADRQFWAQHIQLGFPFLAIGFITTLEYQTDVIILKSVQSATVVGWYSAVTTIVFALTLFSQAYRTAIYPRMVNELKSSTAAIGKIYDLSFFYLGAAAFPIAMGITILSPTIIQLVYGSSFHGAIAPLRIAIWSLVFLYLNVPNSRLMLVREQQNRLVWLVVVSLGINLILNLILDPAFGAVGAAVARLISTTTFFLPNYIFVIRNIHHHNAFRSMARPVFATLVMAIVVWPLRLMSIWIPIFVGAIVYSFIFLLLDRESRLFVLRFFQAATSLLCIS